ncbi:MAG: phosphatase PAP2 family protein [Gammaproteobacteria bacterium]|nr:phosphatase PAP2 family protein [Gammaproteobacteria bacterium]MBU2287441.1 phosphatase PAP2 family protein [Gammaproteobacteria bacterium]MBU2407172.1 phosphatase PAP2 family protein [Gammaproteobacteria bacterium]
MTQTHSSPVPLAACALGLALMFAGWSAAVFLGPWLGSIDRLVYDSLSHRPRDAWFHASVLISWLHRTPFMLGYFAALAIFCWRRGARAWAGTVAVVGPGGLAINALVKLCFARPRPPTLPGTAEIGSLSYPSGHTLAATLLYGLLVAYVCWHRPRTVTGQRPRGADCRIACLAGAMAIVAVASSRLVLGVHYLTDVVAAVLEGGAVVALALAWIAFAQGKAIRDAPRPPSDAS